MSKLPPKKKCMQCPRLGECIVQERRCILQDDRYRVSIAAAIELLQGYMDREGVLDLSGSGLINENALSVLPVWEALAVLRQSIREEIRR